MKSIIEAIYDSNISSIENIITQDAQYRTYLKSLCEAQEKLQQSLTKEQQTLLESYLLLQSKIDGYNREKIFCEGFRIGIAMLLGIPP